MYPPLVKGILKKENCVLATVVETHGSAPQKPGSSAIFGLSGLMEGTVGGGLVEYQIEKEAAGAVSSKKSGYFRFELNDEIAEDNSVICGGGMNILVDATPEKHLPVFKALTESYQNRIPGVLVSIANTNPEGDFIIERSWITSENFLEESKKYDEELRKKINNMLEKSSSGVFSEIVRHTSPQFQDNFIFLESIVPLPVLIIAGAGHVGKALAHIGKLLDFEITVWDDREEFANKKNIPDADNVMSGDLNNTLGKFTPGPDTFIVIVTRAHKNDSDVLKKFIDSKAGYIGMIGTGKKLP